MINAFSVKSSNDWVLPLKSCLVNFSLLKELYCPAPFRSFSIKYASRGSEIYHVNGNSHNIGPGQYLLANHFTEGFVEIDKPVKGICIDVAPDILSEVVASHRRPDTFCADLDLDTFFNTSDFLENSYTASETHLGKFLLELDNTLARNPLLQPEFTREFYFTLAEKIVADHIPIYKQLQSVPALKSSTRKDLFKKVTLGKEYIDAFFRTNLAVAVIAKESNLSEYHFFRLFKSVFGISPHQYIIKKRLLYAEQLIKKEKMSISDAAVQSGFSDIHSFSKSLKKNIFMNAKSTLSTLLLLFSSCIFLSAQSVSGKIKDDENKPIAFSNILLKNAADSTILKVAVTDSTGYFEFENTKPERFFLTVSYIGFKPYNSKVFSFEDGKNAFAVPDITLSNNTDLAGVTVTEKQLFVERKIDRTVVNVDAMISAGGSNVLEVLEKSPGVTVDANGNIKLKGKSGVVIFIDDKPTYLSGTELQNYLSSLPSATVKQIELMTNPPAKYDAAGNAGVINIKTKRNKTAGFSGNLSANINQGKYTRSNNSLNLNFNYKKVSLFANMSLSRQNGFQDLTINRYYKNEDLSPLSSFTQNSYIHWRGNAANLKIGMDYYMTDKTTVGIALKGSLNPMLTTTDNVGLLYNPDNTLNSRIIADNQDESDFKNGLANLNLRHQFDSTGKSLTVDLDYVIYATSHDQLYKNFSYNPAGLLDFENRIDGNLPSNISIYALKSDYSHPLKKGGSFEAGIKSSYTKTDNDAQYLTTINNVTNPNYDWSNHFVYDEIINAAYLNFTKSIGRLDFQVGLRGESTLSKGNQLGNPEKPASTFNRTYNNIFPTAYLSYKLDSAANNILSVNYGKRIDRPYYQDLNPFISPLDKFTYYGGNPYLRPTFSHNVSLTYSFKDLFSINSNYSRTVDGINETLEIKDGIYYSRPGNISKTDVINISLDATVPVRKWWNLHSYSEVGELIYLSDLYTEKLDTKGFYYYFSVNNTFTFGKGWSAELSGDFQSGVVAAQVTTKSSGSLNIAFQKKILKGKGNLKLTFADILYSRRFDGIINNLRLTDADYFSKLDTRFVSFTFSYRFGKNANEGKKHNSQGSEMEQNRVKK